MLSDAETQILEYIDSKYKPLCIIVYGSYADGTANAHSDFDCLVVTKENIANPHDTSDVDGIRLDLFAYSGEEITNLSDFSDFVQIFDGRIAKDTEEGLAKWLVEAVRGHVKTKAAKTPPEKADLQAWMMKMLKRAKNGDIEGLFRHHWLLTDSLEIYCNLRDLFYFGPKKTLEYLGNNDAQGYGLVSKALGAVDYGFLRDWVFYVAKVAARETD